MSFKCQVVYSLQDKKNLRPTSNDDTDGSRVLLDNSVLDDKSIGFDLCQDDWRIEEPASCDRIDSIAREMGPIFNGSLQHMELDGPRCWKIHNCVMSTLEYPTEECTLPEFFAEANLTKSHNIVLAIQLSYALAYLYESEWLSGWWQQANITFFRWGSRIPCKPWLKIFLPDTDGSREKAARCGGHPARGSHPFPQLLELGTVLLELQLGQSLDSFLDIRPARTPLEKWAYATKAFFTKLNGGNSILSRPYRQAIAFCLEPTEGLKNAPGNSMRRGAIYTNVVLPLQERMLESGLENEALEALDMGLIKHPGRRLIPTFEPNLSPNSPPKTVSTPTARSANNTGSKATVPKGIATSPVSELDDDFALFGDVDELEVNRESVLPNSFHHVNDLRVL